jgi:hypothetical protein
MTIRNIMYTVSCGAALCGLAAGDMPAVRIMSAAPLAAQTLRARIDAVPRATPVTFSFPTKAGVCGDGSRIIARRRPGGDYSIMEMELNGSSTFNTSSRSRADLMRNCVEGPAHVMITRGADGIGTLRITVGPALQTDATDAGSFTASDAVRYLLDVASGSNRGNARKIGSKALFAASLADAQEENTTGLIALSKRTSIDNDVRKDVVFWMSQTDDARATTRLKDILADQHEDIDVRKSAIFGLAQQNVPETVPTLLNTARTSRENELRKDAIFWLGQMAGEKSTQGLVSIVGDDSQDIEVRQSAIFAVSQQKGPGAVTMLMDIAQHSKEPELRKNAMFWLGNHASDPRVLKLFEDILTKK